MVSVGAERGLTNWPASRPTFTIGEAAPKVRTTAICNKTRKVSRILSGWNSAKLSAQSPPCSRKAFPSQTSPRVRFSFRASPAKTSGGNVRSCAEISASRSMSSYTGTCLIGLSRQLSGAQLSAIFLSVDCPGDVPGPDISRNGRYFQRNRPCCQCLSHRRAAFCAWSRIPPLPLGGCRR